MSACKRSLTQALGGILGLDLCPRVRTRRPKICAPRRIGQKQQTGDG
jgi:ribosome biogenesis SPOUT family RNA methylase Rps3